jgi:hypothetical protein
MVQCWFPCLDKRPLIRGGFYRPSLVWSLAGLIVWPFTLYNLGVLSTFLSTQIGAELDERMKQHLKENKRLAKETNYSRSVTYNLNGRNFCSTHRGYVGWVPWGAKSGDEICVFSGCCLPFVIRQQERGAEQKQRHGPVGDCYIHGLVKKEATEAIEAETREMKLV